MIEQTEARGSDTAPRTAYDFTAALVANCEAYVAGRVRVREFERRAWVLWRDADTHGAAFVANVRAGLDAWFDSRGLH